MSHNNVPNLFDYATSELSQDAFFCWLIDCANPKYTDVDKPLREKAIGLLNLMLSEEGYKIEYIRKIRIIKKYHNIDILIDLIDGFNRRFVILIEDKTHTNEHDDQIARYRNMLNEDAAFNDATIISVYVKTGHLEFSENIKTSCRVLGRRELLNHLSITDSERISSDIYCDFLRRLKEWEYNFSLFRTLPIDKWKDDQWCGFYESLQNELKDVGGWGYVPNRSGGFWCLHWFWRSYSDQFGSDMNLYLQLEENKLCFKAMLGANEIAKQRQWPYHNILLKVARDVIGRSDVVRKRPRFVLGKYTTLAYWPDYIAKNESGILHLGNTILNLRYAEKIAMLVVTEMIV